MFDYSQAFSRNIGWVTQAEQERLRHCRIAIAGQGGVGGAHLLALARLGIGKFVIADNDTFDVVNFNRQAGAFVSTLGQTKTNVMTQMVHDINPEAEVICFNQGVTPNNLTDFLQGADLFVDGLDYFALDIRRQVFAKCHEMGIPAITAAPIGMSAAILCFMPNGMSFEEYFQLEGYSDEERYIRFLVGVAPALLQRYYVADPMAVNMSEQKTPSTTMACHLCAGLVATEALKILLRRGKLTVAPHAYQFDAYLNRFVRTWRPGGNSHPLQRFTIWCARRKLQAMKELQRGRS